MEGLFRSLITWGTKLFLFCGAYIQAAVSSAWRECGGNDQSGKGFWLCQLFSQDCMKCSNFINTNWRSFSRTGTLGQEPNGQGDDFWEVHLKNGAIFITTVRNIILQFPIALFGSNNEAKLPEIRDFISLEGQHLCTLLHFYTSHKYMNEQTGPIISHCNVIKHTQQFIWSNKLIIWIYLLYLYTELHIDVGRRNWTFCLLASKQHMTTPDPRAIYITLHLDPSFPIPLPLGAMQARCHWLAESRRVGRGVNMILIGLTPHPSHGEPDRHWVPFNYSIDQS